MKIGAAVLAAVTAIGAFLGGAQAADYAACDAPRTSRTLNPYVKCAVEMLARERAGGGYNIFRSFTNDLAYGDGLAGTIKASRVSGPHPTTGKDRGPPYKADGLNPSMCVAGVAEVLIEATNFYAAAHGSAVYNQVPTAMWTRGDARSLRAYVFQFKEVASRGAAHAAERFGMGREKPFNRLKPYDVITFNRVAPRPGHSAIFIGYVRPGGVISGSPRGAVGFRYFSIQGAGRPDAGFGYRNAYFEGQCPSPRGADDDCNVINAFSIADGKFQQNQTLLNTGEFYSGARWRVTETLNKIAATAARAKSVQETAATAGVPPEAAAEDVLAWEYEPDYAQYADGSSIE
jgi:hypothetical protein